MNILFFAIWTMGCPILAHSGQSLSLRDCHSALLFKNQFDLDFFNQKWRSWYNKNFLLGHYGEPIRKNKEIIEHHFASFPGFLEFIMFLAPDFPHSWPTPHEMNNNYLSYQKKIGIPKSKIFQLGIAIDPNQVVPLQTLDPQELSSKSPFISDIMYYRSISQRVIPLTIRPTAHPSVGSFDLLHDLSHAYGFTNVSYGDSVVKATKRALILSRSMTKYEFNVKFVIEDLGPYLENFWFISPTGKALIQVEIAKLKELVNELKRGLKISSLTQTNDIFDKIINLSITHGIFLGGGAIDPIPRSYSFYKIENKKYPFPERWQDIKNHNLSSFHNSGGRPEFLIHIESLILQIEEAMVRQPK